MMKKYKNIVLFMLIICMLFTLSACKSQKFEKVRSFEYNFLKGEYEEEYSKVEKIIELENDVNYKIKISSSLDSGSILMSFNYINIEGEITQFNMTSPITKTIEIPMGITNNFMFSAEIDSETQGSVKVEILSDK